MEITNYSWGEIAEQEQAHNKVRRILNTNKEHKLWLFRKHNRPMEEPIGKTVLEKKPEQINAEIQRLPRSMRQ